jgi:hypothetical protein
MFRSTNPVPTPKIRIRWDRIAASIAVGAVLGALGVWAFTIATEEPAIPVCSTEESTNCFWDATNSGNGSGQSFIDVDGTPYYAVSPNATENPWASSECQTQLTAALEASQRLTDDVATQWSSGASYGDYVYTDNITPVHDRLNYVLTTYCN